MKRRKREPVINLEPEPFLRVVVDNGRDGTVTVTARGKALSLGTPPFAKIGPNQTYTVEVPVGVINEIIEREARALAGKTDA